MTDQSLPPFPEEPVLGPEDVVSVDVSRPIPEVDEPFQAIIEKASMTLPDPPEDLLHPPEFLGPNDIK